MSTKDGLVTNNDELNERPLSPCNKFGDLTGCSGTSGLTNEDTDDHLDTSNLGSVTDVLESGAIGTVDTDGSETLGGNECDINGNFCSGLASSRILVWGISHGPLASRASYTTSISGRGSGSGGGRWRCNGRCNGRCNYGR